MEFITASIFSSIYFVTSNRVIPSLLNAAFLSALAFTPVYNPLLLNKYITGYFVYDTITGHFFDRQNFNLLSGYMHHSVYLLLLFYIRQTNESYLIPLLLPFEIPTFILDLKKLYKTPALNFLFGTSFVVYRVIYNIYVIRQTPPPYKWISSLMLLLHIFWLHQWLKKQNQNRGI